MELDDRVRPVLEDTSFIERYRKLSHENSDLDNKMKNYSCNEVIKIAAELGHELTFNEKENFFKLLENNGGLETQLNISLKYGLVELILGIVKDGERYSVGGPFGMITRLMGESERIKYPVFTDYDQLKNILKESFSIYEDIKKGLLE